MTIKRINRGRGHSYVIDGKKADGVTTVLGAAWPQPWMGPWSAKAVAQTAVDMTRSEWEYLLGMGRDAAVAVLKGAPNRQRDTAAARGTDVHNLAEKIIRGEEVTVPDRLWDYVNSAVKFMNEWQVRPLLVEKTVASYKYGYAGTFDLVGELPDGSRILFDYKTASSIRPKDALQLAAYRWADVYLADPATGLEMSMHEVGIVDCKAVHLRADGYDVIPLSTGPAVFDAFLAALRVARRYRDEEDWVGFPEYPGKYLGGAA